MTFGELSYDERHAAAKRMQKVGGGFASAIAEAWFFADSANRVILERAFNGLFLRYSTKEMA